ncbi:DNA-directed RNA polymerase subunit D [Nanoarchaeota archaeon]
MIEILKNEDLKLSFILRDAGNSYANALRKSSNEIPILAVDTVEISKNDSALFDEMLAHRIGLIPLKSEKKTFTETEKCTCKGKGCMKCTVALTMQVSGETATSADLKSKTVSAIHPDTPLTLLQKGQEIELVAEARLGRGVDHAKYSPGLVWIRVVPHIELSKDKSSLKPCAEKCPKNVYQLDPKVEVKNLMNCDLCMACVEECEKHNGKEKIKVWGDEKDFIVEIESWGQLKPKEILTESCTALKKNIDEFLKEASKIK